MHYHETDLVSHQLLQETRGTRFQSHLANLFTLLVVFYRAIGCQLLLITNRKSHTGFRLVPTSMTLNDLERHNSPYLRFLPNSTDFQADYITVVEDTPIMSVKYCLPVPVSYFWRKL